MKLEETKNLHKITSPPSPTLLTHAAGSPHPSCSTCRCRDALVGSVNYQLIVLLFSAMFPDGTGTPHRQASFVFRSLFDASVYLVSSYMVID